MVRLDRPLSPALLTLLPLALCSVQPVGVAFAGEGGDGSPQMTELFALPMEALLDIEVTVASRYLQPLSDAPATVSVITHRQIAAMGLKTLDELLAYIPGVQVGYDSNLATRTPIVTVRGHHNAPILVLLDGRPLNDYNNSNPFIFQRLIGLADIERVEVMRGPGSSIYGSSGFVGIVNLISRNEGSDALAEVGSHGERRAAGATSLEGRDWRVRVAGEYFSDNGESYLRPFDQFGSTSSTSDPRAHLELHAKGDYRDFYASALHSRTVLEDFYQFGAVGNGLNDDEVTFDALTVGYRPWSGGATSGDLAVGYRRYHVEQLSLGAPQGAGPFTAAAFQVGPYFTHEVWSATAHFTVGLGAGRTLAFGADYERAESPDAYSYANYDYFDPAVPYLGGPQVLEDDALRFVADVPREVYGVYGQYEWVWDRWQLAAGARYDHFNDFGGQLSPKFAATYRLAPDTALKYIYGEAFQAPAVSQVYNQNNPATLGNLALQPDEITTHSLGLSYRTVGYAAEATLFWNRITNLSERVVAGTQNQYQNVGDQDTRGVELDLRAQPTDALTLRLTATRYFRNAFSAGSAVLTDAPPDAYVADWLGSWEVNYKAGPWNFNLNGIAHAPVDVLPAQGAVSRVNAVVSYEISRELSATVSASNLLDKHDDSASVGSGLGLDAAGNVVRATPDRGRWVYAGLHYTF